MTLQEGRTKQFKRTIFSNRIPAAPAEKEGPRGCVADTNCQRRLTLDFYIAKRNITPPHRSEHTVYNIHTLVFPSFTSRRDVALVGMCPNK